MKAVLVVLVIAAAGWWFFVGGRKLSEAQVEEFYRSLEVATLDRKPEDICALLADEFTASGTVAIGGQRRDAGQNRKETCDGYRELYATWDKLGEKMGGVLQLDSSYKIHGIAISADKKTATVDISSSLDVAGSIMSIRSHRSDTLVRRYGKVLWLRSVGAGSVGAGS